VAERSGAIRSFSAIASREEAERFAKAVKTARHSYYPATGVVGDRNVMWNEPTE